MPRLIRRFVEPPRACSYLPAERASLDHRLISSVGPADLDQLLCRGWRRFGNVYFRPACPACNECVPIRLPVDRFTPSTSQTRALRRSQRLTRTLGRPVVDDERLALYAAWHAQREGAREWDASPLDAEGYAQQFATPHAAGFELSFREGSRLVAVGLCDVTAHSMSAIYFFYHPDIARLSPGVANVMSCLELARERGIAHLYLGFRVLGCPSMRYKAKFLPHELLEGRPGFDEQPVWRPGP